MLNPANPVDWRTSSRSGQQGDCVQVSVVENTTSS